MSDPAIGAAGLPLGLPGARALIIGTGTHVPGSVLPDVPAAAATVRALAQELVARCGLAPEHVRTVVDPENPVVLGEELTAAAESADSVLLVYYVGHGLVGDDNELYLATRVTDQLTRGLAYKGLRYTTLRETLAGSRARSVVVVLDCCFSGRAAPLGGASRAFEASYPGGGFVLASAAPEELALAPIGAPYTAFSGELLRLLSEGDPTEPPQLTLDDLHRALSRTLRDRGFPAPRRQSDGRAGELVLAPNPAYRPPDPGPGGHPRPHPGPCPYRGLAAYAAEDARYFFGREELTAKLVARVAARLAEGGLLVVVGPSGAGKSSLLRAGLLPALDHGLPEALRAGRRPRVVITPGERPVARLARALAELPGQTGLNRTDPETIRAELMAAPESILTRLPADGSRPVLVVDQFEELFTACTDEREREVFVAALAAAGDRGSAPDAFPHAAVVLGLRADFYGHCAAYPVLADALQDGQLLVGPMRTGELRDAVEKPALLAGLALEPGLVDLLLRDLRTGGDRQHGPGAALPLLSYALLATWQKRAGRLLTMAGYQASGGIWGAVAQTAQATYDGLDGDAQRAARQMLLRMVHVLDGAEDTRRRVPLDELGLDTDPAARTALDALVGARLVVVGDGHAELAHEAVLRAWQQLRDWIEHDRAGLLVRQRLHDAAEAWERDGRDEGALYRGARLATAAQWVEEAAQRHGTTPTARAFITAGQTRQAAERRAERRRTTRLRALAGTLAVLLLVAVAGVGAAAWQKRVADEQRDVLASKVAAQAVARVRPTDPTLALQIALAARRVADTPEARSSLLDSALTPYYTPVDERTRTVRQLAYRPERHLLAGASTDHTVRLWDLSDPFRERLVSSTASAGSTLALDRDGRLLATQDTDSSVRLWNVADPARPEAVATLPDTSGALALSPDGHRLAAFGTTGSVLWDLTDPRHPVRAGALPSAIAPLQSGAFSSDGRLLALAHAESEDSTSVQLWNVTNPAAPRLAATLADTHALAVAFSPNRPLLAIGTNGRGAGLWDTGDPAKPVQVTGPGHSGPEPVVIDSIQIVAALGFSPDGRTLALGASDDSDGPGSHVEAVDIGDPANAVRTLRYPTPGAVYSVVAADGGSTLLDAGAESPVRSWHPAPATLLAGTGADGAFTRDSRTLAWGLSPSSRRTDPDIQQYRLWRTTGPYDARPAGTFPVLHGGIVRAVDARTLIAYSDVGLPQLWDVADPDHPRQGGTLNELAEYVEHGGEFSTFTTDVAIGDGLVVTNGRDGRTHIWDVGDAHAPTELSSFESPKPPGGLHLAGRTLVSLARVGAHRMSMWDLGDPRHPAALAPIDLSDSIASEDDVSSLLAVAVAKLKESNPKTIQLWDLGDPRHPDHGELPLRVVNSFALSHDRRTLAVATDKTIDLWDVTDIHHPAQVASLAAERQGGLVFSPDNRMLLSHVRPLRLSDPDAGQTHLWRVADPRRPVELGMVALPDIVYATGFSPDGNSVLVSEAGGSDQPSQVVLLDPDIDRLTRRLCDSVGATITREQWRQYFPSTPWDPPCR